MIQQDTIVTVDLGNPDGERTMPFSEARQIMMECLDRASFSQAASIARQLADQLPQDPGLQSAAAEASYLHQQIEVAFEYIERALAISPGNISCLVLKSRLCMYSGDPAQAMQLIDQALDFAPRYSQLYGIKAELLVNAGRIDDARGHFLKSIQLHPGNADSMLGLTQLPGDHFSEELIKTVESGIRSGQMPVESRIKAHFALAHALDRKGDVAGHFAHLKAGNTLKSRSLKYDPADSEREANGTMEYFSEAFFARQQAVPGNPARIIFIVGFPRCGSTLVEQILSSHPAVSAAGETYALRHAIRDFQQSRAFTRGYPYWIDGQPAGALADIAEDYMRKVNQFNQNEYLTDKLLDNYLFIGIIHLIFPNAIVIHVQRDPIDTCYSCYKRLFHLGSLPFAYDLEHLARKYRDYRRVIRHWKNVLPGTIHTVRYEDLIDRQKAVTADLLKHCGLPWHDGCLEFYRNARPVLTNSNVQVRQPLYAASIGRWKRHEKYLGPLLGLAPE